MLLCGWKLGWGAGSNHSLSVPFSLAKDHIRCHRGKVNPGGTYQCLAHSRDRQSVHICWASWQRLVILVTWED